MKPQFVKSLLLITVLNFFSINLFAQNIFVLPSSTAKLAGGNKFRATVCLGSGKYHFPLANKKLNMGVVHIQSDGTYALEEDALGIYKTVTSETDNKGCLIISDKVVFGKYDGFSSVESGHVIGNYDSIAERNYGLLFKNASAVTILHVIFNQGVATGRININ